MNNRLEKYLGEMETRLRALPPEDREQEITEVAQHLDALIDAGERNGETEAEATESAIAQFGAARDIGNGLYQTGKRKRFAPLVEVGLFSVAFSTLFYLTEQMGKAAIYAIALSRALEMQMTHWPLIGWPVSWIAGAAALAFLIANYGVRGVFRTAFGATPTGAAIRWLFWVRVVTGAIPLLFTFFLSFDSSGRPLFGGVSFGDLSSFQQTAIIGSSYALTLMSAFGVAYFVGRGSKARQSVADAVGCAAAAVIATGLLGLLFQFVPIPWSRPGLPTSYTVSTPDVGILGLLRVAVAYFGARIGENARRVAPTGRAA